MTDYYNTDITIAVPENQNTDQIEHRLEEALDNSEEIEELVMIQRTQEVEQ